MTIENDYLELAKLTENGEILWHYTDWHGLNGIISNNSIWASHIAYLNDAQELAHGRELLGRMINKSEHEILKKLLKDERWTPESCEVYVASLSSHFDDLGQWRAYGSKEGGFAIGMEMKKLVEINHELSLAECQYSEDSKESYLKKAFEYLDTSLEKIKQREQSSALINMPPDPRRYNLYMQSAQLHFWPEIIKSIACLKHEKFSNEREYRLIFCRPRYPSDPLSNFDSLVKWISDENKKIKLKFRNKGSLPIPYLDVSLDHPEATDSSKSSPIRGVLVGPCHHPNLSTQAIVRLIRSQKSVVTSKWPNQMFHFVVFKDRKNKRCSRQKPTSLGNALSDHSEL